MKKYLDGVIAIVTTTLSKTQPRFGGVFISKELAMTELEEVAQAIYKKHFCLWPLTRKQANALAWVELPQRVSQQILDDVSDSLMEFNIKEFSDDRTPSA